nr:hypothetical protein [uncultured Bacteroides sp.]
MPGLKKLEIVGYKDGDFSQKSGNVFSMMVNPANYDESKAISYSRGKSRNHKGAPAFNSYQESNIKIEFTLDNTGAFVNWMEYTGAVKKEPLSDIIQKLEKTVYTYIGDKHEPPYLKIIWGTLNFNGRLKNLTTNYLLFSSEGEPLRAKVILEIIKYVAPKKQEKQDNSSSPDLSHLVMVKDGDTLPALCRRIYENEAYCVEVARINGLTEFRHLEPGIRLLFPPLSNE